MKPNRFFEAIIDVARDPHTHLASDSLHRYALRIEANSRDEVIEILKKDHARDRLKIINIRKVKRAP